MRLTIIGTGGLAIPLAREAVAKDCRVTFGQVDPLELPDDLRGMISDCDVDADLILNASAKPCIAEQPVLTETWPAPEGQISLWIALPFGDRRLIETADDPPAPLQSLADRLRWTISVSKARRLPIGARLFEAQLRQLDQALLEGANVADLDEALVAEGADIGFFKAMDAAGLDTMLARLREGTPAVTLQMIQEGRLGHATGVGWYRYPGGAGPVEDPITEDLARTEAWLARVQQSEVPANRVMSALRAALEALAETIMTEGHDRNCVAKIARLGLGVPQLWIDTWPR